MAEVPDTIGKKKAEQLKAAGAKQDWFSKKAVDQRLKSAEQQRKRGLS